MVEEESGIQCRWHQEWQLWMFSYSNTMMDTVHGWVSSQHSYSPFYFLKEPWFYSDIRVHFFSKWPVCLRESWFYPSYGVDLISLNSRNLISLARDWFSTPDISQSAQGIPLTIVIGQGWAHGLGWTNQTNWKDFNSMIREEVHWTWSPRILPAHQEAPVGTFSMTIPSFVPEIITFLTFKIIFFLLFIWF